MGTDRIKTPSEAMEYLHRDIDAVRYVGRTIHHDPEAAELASTTLIAAAERMSDTLSSLEDALSRQIPHLDHLSMLSPQSKEARL